MKFYLRYQHEKFVTIHANSLEEAGEAAKQYVAKRNARDDRGDSFKVVSVEPEPQAAPIDWGTEGAPAFD